MTTKAVIGAQLVISDRLVNALADEQRAETIKRMLAGSFARNLVINGTKVVELSSDIERDESVRAWEVKTFAEVEADPRLPSLLAQAQAREDQVIAALNTVNAIPWWRLLWLKVRRIPIVKVGWEGHYDV